MDENLKNIELQSKKIEDETACVAVGGMGEVDGQGQEIPKPVFGGHPLTEERDLSMPSMSSLKDMDDDVGSLLEIYTDVKLM